MNSELRDFIRNFLDGRRILTLATNRPDGWPQATTVTYVNEGLTLYCFISRLSQKYANIRRDPRVSVAIAGDFDDPLKIRGLSLAARVELIDDKREYDRICALFLKRTPDYAPWGRVNPAFSPLVRLTPETVSVIDYSKGFGHSDLVKVSQQDLHSGGDPALRLSCE